MKIPKLDRFRIALGAGILLAAVVVGGLGWAFFQQLSLAEELRSETEKLEQAVATQEAHQAYLTATLTYVHTDQYVEEWARREAKMAKPGEVLVVPLLSGGASQAAPTPTSRPQGDAASDAQDRPIWVVLWHVLVGYEN